MKKGTLQAKGGIISSYSTTTLYFNCYAQIFSLSNQVPMNWYIPQSNGTLHPRFSCFSKEKTLNKSSDITSSIP